MLLTNLQLPFTCACCSDEAEDDPAPDMYGGNPHLPPAPGSSSSDGEQEVPHGSDLCQRASTSTAKRKGEFYNGNRQQSCITKLQSRD